MSIAAKRAFEVRGWHVLIAILAFFGFVIAVNVAFAVIAVQSFPGEDVRRSYLQGLQYNQTLADRRAQAALGWRANVEMVPTATGASVVVQVRGRDGAVLPGLRMNGQLQRVTDARFDREIVFEPTNDGGYVAVLGPVQQGRWRLRARADGGEGRVLDFETELTWSPSR